MEEKKSIYFQRPNKEKGKIKTLSCNSDSEEESFSDVFKVKKSLHKTTDIPRSVCSKSSQENFKTFKFQSKASDADSTSSEGKPSEESFSNEEYKKIMQCPICLNLIQEKSNTWKVNHFKQCAMKHKVGTQKLMEALRVQRLQFEEREKLGLPNISTEKQSAPRRNHSGNTSTKQMGTRDPSMQLALALSASYQEAQEAALIEETTNLFEAGLEAEAINCCKTLESLPVCQLKPPAISKKDKTARKNISVPVLLSRTKEERERLISEKVDFVIFLQEHILLCPLPTEPYELTSKTLKKITIENAPSWELSKVENSQDSAHYTTAFLRYKDDPEKKSTFRENNRLESIDKQYSEVEENNLQVLEVLFHTKKVKSNSAPHHQTSSDSTTLSCSRSLKIKDHTSAKSDGDCKSVSYHERIQMNELRNLSENLGAMIGKQTFSDINIFSKEETVIPCHKIILLARIPTMLNEIIKEEIDGRTREMLMWNMEKHLCLIVLRYLYTGLIDLDTLDKLDISQLNELKQFCDMHHIRVVSKIVKNVEVKMSNDRKHEHFDALPSENIIEDSNKPKSLDKWLSNLKNKASTKGRILQKRFIKIDSKMTPHLSTFDIEEKSKNIERSVGKNRDSESTDGESIQTESNKLNQPGAQGDSKKCNEIVSLTPKNDTDNSSVHVSKQDLESVKNNDLKTFCLKDETKENLYNSDCDIYDQETYVSVKTSDTENLSNRSIEVRHIPTSMNSIYDKNTLSHSLENDNSQNIELGNSKKRIEMSQQTLNASPELFSDCDEDYDHSENMKFSKVNTQMNLHRLINLMDDDISNCATYQISVDDKKRKRSPSQISLENLKRSKQILNENRGSPRCLFLNTKVNKHRESETSKHFKMGDLNSNLNMKTNLSIPCVAGLSKSKNAARNLTIDFDKIEVDTSAPLQASTLNLTEENLMLFDKMNEESNDSLFERENPPMLDRILLSNTSSHGSSLIFETYMNKYKDSSKTKTLSTLHVEKPKEANIGYSYDLKRKKSGTPDFLKAKFHEPQIIEIKSSSGESTKWYPTKDLSRHYQLSQKNKKITPSKYKKFHSQQQKKLVTLSSSKSQSQKLFQSQNIKRCAKLFPSDSSDELSQIINKKSERTRDLSFKSISPIPHSNIYSKPCRKVVYENRRNNNSKSQALEIAKEKSKESMCNYQNISLKNLSSNKTQRKQGISRKRNQNSSDSLSIAIDSITCTSTSTSASRSSTSKSKYPKRPSHQRKSPNEFSRLSPTACSSSSPNNDQCSSSLDITGVTPVNKSILKEDKNSTLIPLSPSNRSNLSSPRFSPRYLWDDPDNNDYNLLPIEDPILSLSPSEKFNNSTEIQNSKDDKLFLPKTTYIDQLIFEEIEREVLGSSFAINSSKYSQTLQNSQFLKRYEEYFGINTKEKQTNEDEIFTKYPPEQKKSSISKNGSSSLQNLPLSPNVIIHKPAVTSDSSSISSPRKRRSNHHKHLINYERVDSDYFNEKNCHFKNNETTKKVSKCRSTENRLDTVSLIKPTSSSLLSNIDHNIPSYGDDDNSKQTLATINKDRDKNKNERIKTCQNIHEKMLLSQSDATSISNISIHSTVTSNFQMNIKKPSYSIDDTVQNLKIGIPKKSTKSSDISADSENESNNSSNIKSAMNRKSEVHKAEKRARRFELSSSSLLSSPICEPIPCHSQPSISLIRSSHKRGVGRKSFQKSVNDNFPEESYVNQLGAIHEMDTSRTTAATSTRKSLNDTSIMTPLADYSAMETPLLKKELTKFGLKPSLGKGKAKLMLRYIYNQTHLYVDSEPENLMPKRRENIKEKTKNIDSESENPVLDKRKNVKEKTKNTARRSKSDVSELKKTPKKTVEKDKNVQSQKRTEITFDAIESDGCMSSDEESNSETYMGFPTDNQQVYEESIIFEQNLGCQGDTKSQSTPLFLSEVDKILRSEENYRKILCYEPLWLEHLYKDLKQRGVRCDLKKLMDYLDEKCITFRTTRKKPNVKSKVRPTVKSKGRKPQAIGCQLVQPVKKS